MLLPFAMLGSGCSSQSISPSDDVYQQQQNATIRGNVEQLNRQISNVSAQPGAQSLSKEYFLGPGDVIDVAVFQAEELSKTVRVNGRGTVILPMLGEVKVQGLTAAQTEEELSSQLIEFLHSPQVSVFISEYRSQEISVLGEVNKPGIMNVTRTRTLLEVLTLAGGLNENAGSKVYVQMKRTDPQTGEEVAQNAIADLKMIVSQPEHNFVLKNGDTVYVPEAGIIFVEGAVEKPGAFPLEGETTVLKAIAQAGGLKHNLSKDSAKVIRKDVDDDGNPVVLTVDLDTIRVSAETDVLLRDGDIVVVGVSGFKRALRGVWGAFTGIFSVGYSL